MRTEPVVALRVGEHGPEPDHRWSEALRAVCEVLAQATGEQMEAISVTLCLGESSDEALTVARLGKELAVERGLRATAVLSGHAVTFRFTRPERAAWLSA